MSSYSKSSVLDKDSSHEGCAPIEDTGQSSNQLSNSESGAFFKEGVDCQGDDGGVLDELTSAGAEIVGDLRRWMGLDGEGDVLDDDINPPQDCDLLEELPHFEEEVLSQGSPEANLPKGVIYNYNGILVFDTHDNACKFLSDGLSEDSLRVVSSGNCTDFTKTNCTSLEGLSHELAIVLKEEIISPYLKYLEECEGAQLSLTGGTEAGHAQSHGQNSKYPLPGHPWMEASHGKDDDGTGDKVDFSVSDGVLRSWIEKNWTFIGNREGKHGGPMWRSPSGKLTGTFESSPPHFDVNLSVSHPQETDLDLVEAIDAREQNTKASDK